MKTEIAKKIFDEASEKVASFFLLSDDLVSNEEKKDYLNEVASEISECIGVSKCIIANKVMNIIGQEKYFEIYPQPIYK